MAAMTSDRACEHVQNLAAALYGSQGCTLEQAREAVRDVRYGDHEDGAEAIEVLGETRAVELFLLETSYRAAWAS